MDQKNKEAILHVLNPSEEQRKKMFRAIVERKECRRNRFSFAHRQIFISAAILILVFTATVFAAVLQLDVGFIRFFKATDSTQEQALLNGLQSLNYSVKNKSGALEVKQILGDKNMTYLLMEFIAPEGTVLKDTEYSFAEHDVSIENQNFSGSRILSLKDDDRLDNRIPMVMSIFSKETLQGKKVRLTFSDLASRNSPDTEFQSVVSGGWDMSLFLDFNANASFYPMNHAVSLFGYEATVKSVSLSPVSIVMKLESPFFQKINQASEGGYRTKEDKNFDNYPITVHYKDGTSETTSVFRGHLLSEYGRNEMILVKLFDHVISDKEISKLSFFGTTIVIPEQNVSK